VSLRRTLAISRRIAEFFRRDHRSLALVFVAPIVIMALLGWVIRDQAPPTTRLAVVNQAAAPGELVRDRLVQAAVEEGIDVVSVTTEEAARTGLAASTIDIALLLRIEDATPALTIITPGLSITEDSARISELQQFVPVALGLNAPLITTETIYGSGEGDFFDSFAPALLGFVVFFLVFVLTGISFLRERVGGTLERLLATPVRRSEIVTGYSVGFGIFATLQVAIVLLFLLGSVHIDAIGPLPEINLGLGVTSAGPAWLAFLIGLLLALCAVNLGIFLSTFARTEFQILQFIPLVIVPQVLLSGIFWPVESLPGVLQPIALLFPMTYGIHGLREVLTKGADLATPAVQLDLLVLAGIAALLIILATLTIRREVA
jgi:ABC-2 type transport system permease protein